jgi:nitrate reductase alpha subunit
MSQFLDRLMFFRKNVEKFSDGWGSCSWKIYVKSGLITWETQQIDYPRTRPEIPNHEPRGCPRGASYSSYIYSAARLKHPLVRSRRAIAEALSCLDPQAHERVSAELHTQLVKELEAERERVRFEGGAP